MTNPRDFILGAAFLALALSGCATTKVEKLKDSPGMERVTQKKCALEAYPFYFTVKELSKDHGNEDLGLAAIVIIPLALVFDAVIMPWELYSVFDPKCDTASVNRPIAGYPRIDRLSARKIVKGGLLTLYGEGLSRDMVVHFGDVKVHAESTTGAAASVRVPESMASGERNLMAVNSVGQSGGQPILILSSKPPILQTKNLSFISEDRDDTLSAGKSGAIHFTLTNRPGAGDAVDVVARVQAVPTNSILEFQEVPIGTIVGGSSEDVTIPLSAGLDIPTGKAMVTITFEEADGFPPDPIKMRFGTRKLAIPELAVADVTMDDRFYPDRKDKPSVGNGDGILQPGEQVEIVARLVNRGEGTSTLPMIVAQCSTPGASLVTQPKLNTGSISSGQWAEFNFVLSLRKDFAAHDVKIDILISDGKVGRFNTDIPMVLSVGKAFPKVAFRNIKGHSAPSKNVEIPSFGEELLPPPRATKANPDAIAVIIGVQNYKNLDVPSVEYALNDAAVFEEYATKALGISPENVILARDASKGDLERIFGTASNSKGQLYNYVQSKPGKSDVYVFYSGHGAPDPETKKSYLVPSDADPNYVKVNGYPLQVLFDNLNAIPARSAMVVLDACFSGGSGSPKRLSLIAKASPLMMTTDKPAIGKVTLFASSAGNQISSWYTQKRHGLFTYFFLKALHGEAAKNNSRQITAAEVRDYLHLNVTPMARRLYGREQSPRFYGDESQVLVRY